MLVERTPVGGAASHGGHRELCAVAWATPVPVAFLLKLAHVRPTPAAQLTQRGAQGLVQMRELLVVEGGAASRVEAGPPEDLVDQEVAQAGQTLLVHEARFQRCGRSGPCGRYPKGGGQLGPGHGQRIGAQPALVG